MSVTFLTLAEWEDILHGRPVPSGPLPALGTIMDLIELADRAKKGRGHFHEGAFRQGWKKCRTQDGALNDGSVCLVSLDQDCLAESLFDHCQGSCAVKLWPLISNTTTTPSRSVRRLILRPSETKWWGDAAFHEMEDGLGEECNWNAGRYP
jgi:hypothetical protein